jgi:hypothetical protein
MIMFHIGQQVVCIDDRNNDAGGRPNVCCGCVYTINEILDHGLNRLAFQFLEKRWEGDDAFLPGYKSTCFRPCKTTSIEIFRKLLAPTPELVS